MRQSLQSKSMLFVKSLAAIAVGVTVILVGIIASAYLAGRIRNVIDESKEKALVESLHIGMSRKELYAQSRRIGLRSGNGGSEHPNALVHWTR